ncbi:MAG: T9SS type A sorting domain-containing protein [Saprospiraceae bacterium]|nr:T9SS type A sorting domain-containing protein [Saprospiraceae bacterium]MBK9728939.1 T9SS type A sorting domain-containing protein [Saprospiraceae bacterium]
MKYTICFIILNLTNYIVKCQTLEPIVIATSGAFYSNNSISLSQTVGEMCLVKTLFNNTILTQGFQQAYSQNSTINTDIENTIKDFIIYPTVVNENIILEFNSKKSMTLFIRLINIHGQCTSDNFKLITKSGHNIHTINTFDFPKGMYYLNAYDLDMKTQITTRHFVKQN